MYTFDSRVRYSETGEDGALALSSVINYMQDCSTFQSEALGVGLAYLKEHKRAWLLSSWQLEIERLPVMAEEITVGTWAYEFKGIYGYRNFVINDKEGGHLVKANSIWVYYDLDRQRPAKPAQEEMSRYQTEPKLAMSYAGRKIQPPEGGTALAPFPVRRSQIDTNGHMNNGQYIRAAQDCISEPLKITALRAEYKKSAMYGDIIYPVAVKTEKGYVISLNDSDGKAYAIADFEGDKE